MTNVAPLSLVVWLTATTQLVLAQGVTIQAPEPSKELIVKICTTDYFGRNSRCEFRQFLERRGDDLVYVVQREGSDEKGELVLTSHLSSKVRPYPPATYTPHTYFLQFPLENGRSWKGTFDQAGESQTQRRTRSAQVTGYLDVTLKAGTFKAFRIDAFNHWSQANRPAVERYHYCPDLTMVCQYESREFDMKFEVVEVTKVVR